MQKLHVLAMALGAVVMLVPGMARAAEDGGKDQVRIAQMRGVPEKWNLDANFALFLELVDRAAASNPDFFITPEGWLDGYAAPDKASTRERILGIAQDLNTSPYLEQVAAKAREHGFYICFGFTSLEGGKAFNASGLWGPEGQLVGVYHKTHLQNHDLQYDPGEALPVWPTPWGPVGMMICADRRWPETVRTLRLQGARLILNPTYGFHNDLNLAMLRTRAYESQCFIAFTHPKQSLVTGPKGDVVLNESPEEPGLSVCEIDLSRAKEDNHLRDRRPELYGILTEPTANARE